MIIPSHHHLPKPNSLIWALALYVDAEKVLACDGLIHQQAVRMEILGTVPNTEPITAFGRDQGLIQVLAYPLAFTIITYYMTNLWLDWCRYFYPTINRIRDKCNAAF